MLDIAIPIQIALLVATPLLAAWLVVRFLRKGSNDSLRLFAGGMVSYVAAQAALVVLAQMIGQIGGLPAIPSDWSFVANAAAFGLAIGVGEELACFFVLRLWLKDVRSWAQGLMLGLGHGGAESIFSGIVTLMWFTTMITLRSGAPAGEALSEAEQANIDQALASYFSTPWHVPMLAGLQQVCMLALSVGLASLVMRVFLTGRMVYLPAAMALHSLAVAVTIYAGQLSAVHSAVAAAFFGMAGLVIVRRLALHDLQTAAAVPAPAAARVAENPAAPARPRKRRAKKD